MRSRSTARLVAAKQIICRLDGIDVGAIDGRLGTQTTYAIGVFDARKANGGNPVADMPSLDGRATG